MSIQYMRPHKNVEFGWHLMHDRIFTDVLPYQYSLDFESSFETLPTKTEEFLRYVQFVKNQRKHWRTNWWLKIQLNVFGFLRNIWLMLLMVTISTLLIYTGMMSYFDNTEMAVWFSILFVTNIFVVKHSVYWLKESASKHYALSKIPILVCTGGWLLSSIHNLIDLGFFSISNLPMIVIGWTVTTVGAQCTRIEKPLMNTSAFIFLCGIFVIGFDELVYISRGFGIDSLSRISHQQSELLYGLWGFQVLYVILCIVTAGTIPKNERQI